MENITLQEVMSKDEIEDKLGQWYKVIEDTINSQIPTINQIIEHKPILSLRLTHSTPAQLTTTSRCDNRLE